MQKESLKHHFLTLISSFPVNLHSRDGGDLVKYISEMQGMFFGLTINDLRSLAFTFAEDNIPHRFNRADRRAGKDWYYSFMTRHPELTLRSPEPTSAARAMCFNRATINKFFDLLEDMMDKHNFHPSHIFNVDETGITTVPNSTSKVIAVKGQRQVGCLSSAERGQLMTVELCMSATGHFIPPFFVIPRVRMNEAWRDNAPTGAEFACHPSGWMQSDIFLKWLQHFIRCSGASKVNQVLLILDGHATHTKNVEALDYARENGVYMLCLPPHCTYKLQPLGVAYMKPLGTVYTQAVNSWL